MRFTVKEYADHWRVDERTVRRWIVKGAVQVEQSPGSRIVVVEAPKADGAPRPPMDNRGQPRTP